jgi:Holliday junction resolvase
MSKNLISEIHRIHEIMGVKSKNLILESSCPFCVKFLDEITNLVDLLKKGDLDLTGFTSKIDDLESKIDDMALSINEKQALKTKIQKAKSTGITDGDSFKNLLKKEFDKVDQFKSTLDSADATKIDTVAVMKDPKTAQLSFDSPNSKTELAEIELSFTKPETEKLYKDTFSTLDDVANFYDNYFRELLIKKGYQAEFIENYVSIWKNWVKNNETLKKWYNESNLDVDEFVIGDPLKRNVDGEEEVLEYDEINFLYDQIIQKQGKDLSELETKLLDDIEEWKNGGDPNWDYVVSKNEIETRTNITQNQVKTLDDLELDIKEKYDKIKQKTKKKFLWEKDLENDVEMFLIGKKINFQKYKTKVGVIKTVDKIISNFLTGNNKIEFTKIIRKALELTGEFNFVKSTMNDTFPNGLTDEIKNVLIRQPGFEEIIKKLETNENDIGYFVKKGSKEWDQLNMLDTNTADNLVLFRELFDDFLKIKEIDITNFPKKNSQEQQELLKEFFNDIKNNPQKVANKIKEYPDQYVKKSTQFTESGDLAEKEVLKLLSENGYEILWRPTTKGNIIDKKGVDLIVKKDNKTYIVQIKATDAKIYQSPNKDKLQFFQTRGVFIDDGLLGIKDKDGKIVIIPKEESKFYVKDKITGEKKLYNAFSRLPRYMELDANKVIKNF